MLGSIKLYLGFTTTYRKYKTLTCYMLNCRVNPLRFHTCSNIKQVWWVLQVVNALHVCVYKISYVNIITNTCSISSRMISTYGSMKVRHLIEQNRAVVNTLARRYSKKDLDNSLKIQQKVLYEHAQMVS